MKKTFLLLCSVILSSIIYSQSYSFETHTRPECFREISTIESSQLETNILIEADTHSIVAVQDEQVLGIADYNRGHKYIPFGTNVVQTPHPTYLHRYILGGIDTHTKQEVMLNLTEPLEKESFDFQFSYDSQYHIPKFYISEDGVEYFRVLESDIPEYNIQSIRIYFERKGEEEIREIIKINSLALIKRKETFQISNIDIEKNLTIYQYGICGGTFDDIEVSNFQSNEKLIPLDFTINPEYQEKLRDSDNDGVSDLTDNCKQVKNSDQTDKNVNGIGDACEFDIDEDTIPDEIDNCRNIANNDQKDDDNDEIGNLCDNCKFYNPNQADTDNNGIGDVCDTKKKHLQENDEDGDGVLDYKDNCRKISNPLQEDSDNDGTGDVCDNCKMHQNDDQLDFNENGVGDICEDSDKDGIDGMQDNCMNVINPKQEDDDNDGIGNLCEDDDHDKIIFVRDNCPHVYNPEQRDTDDDGQGDVCDTDDNRFLESNKHIFIFLIILFIGVFLYGIWSMVKKIQK